MLDLSGRLVVIIGGGAVAARKARGLIDAGALKVRVVAPEISDEVPAEVEGVREVYHKRHLEGAGLVFAATDRAEVNRVVVEDGRALGLWVNRADADEEGASDFSTPAMMKSGGLVVTVSAGGSPALAAKVRDVIESSLETKWGRMAEALRELRPRVLESGWDIERRRQTFRLLAGEEAMAVLEQGGVEAVWEWVGGGHEE